MQQLTINDLFKILKNEIKKGNGEKYVLVSNDVEGNGFHGLWYGVTSKEEDVVQLMEWSEITDSITYDAKKIVILG